MRKFFLLSLAFVAILTACTKESFAPQGDGLQEQQSQERAFEEKVRAFAASNLVSMQHGRGMPLTNLPNVESLEPIVSESNLRSGSGRDTVAYIVNFEQNGSMVIAGSRLLPLTTVAICDSRMAISDTFKIRG